MQRVFSCSLGTKTGISGLTPPWLESQLDKKITKTVGSSDICEIDKGIRLRLEQ